MPLILEYAWKNCPSHNQSNNAKCSQMKKVEKKPQLFSQINTLSRYIALMFVFILLQ
jgi:hypothetical protein